MGIVFPEEGGVCRIDAYTDSDWASDTITRRSVTGGVIMVAGCKLFSQAKGQDTVSTSSCQAETIAASDFMKEACLIQHVLDFVGFGVLLVVLHMDSSSARSFLHRKGAGSMKHIDVRHMWLQEVSGKGIFISKKVPRDVNIADLLNHAAGKKEIETLVPLMGMQIISGKSGFPKIEAKLVNGSGPAYNDCTD